MRAQQGRSDEALALADRMAAAPGDEPPARRALTRARILGARGDQRARLAEAEAGLAEETLWYATRTELLREKERAYSRLGERDALVRTILERAEHTGERFAYYDAAWATVEDGDFDRAAAVLVQACAPQKSESGDTSPAARALAESADFFAALGSSGRHEQAAALRIALERLAAAPDA